MPGVHIGHGAIIASAAVVDDDAPDYGIAGGNPAKLIRSRYNDDNVARTVMSGIISELERIAPRT